MNECTIFQRMTSKYTYSSYKKKKNKRGFKGNEVLLVSALLRRETGEMTFNPQVPGIFQGEKKI